jgi:hypothetical protein
LRDRFYPCWFVSRITAGPFETAAGGLFRDRGTATCNRKRPTRDPGTTTRYLGRMDIRPGTYRHYKGNLYEVIDTVTHSETEERLVLYRAMYGEFGLWVRPLGMFLEEVIIDGKTVHRFAPVDE